MVDGPNFAAREDMDGVSAPPCIHPPHSGTSVDIVIAAGHEERSMVEIVV